MLKLYNFHINKLNNKPIYKKYYDLDVFINNKTFKIKITDIQAEAILSGHYIETYIGKLTYF